MLVMSLVDGKCSHEVEAVFDKPHMLLKKEGGVLYLRSLAECGRYKIVILFSEEEIERLRSTLS